MKVQETILENLATAVPQSVLFQTVDGGVVLLDIVSGDYYGLNEVGSRIWTLLQEGRSPGEVLRVLLSDYSLPEEDLRSDIQQFLQQLQTKGLIHLNERDAA